MWNLHIIHHSSEEFNLACALRQALHILSIHSISVTACRPAGVPTVVIATVGPLHLFAQFWYHTQHINKMGF
jgi:sterol desaturase/sphingolipid hydroxylase (fatty acid hydroxylase superfamily)